MLDIYDVIRKPLVTERAMRRLEEANTYVFEIHPQANKVQVRKAVERLFGVKVLGVNTARVAGKPRRRGMTTYHTPARKKAYVKLREGDTIELF